MVVGKREHNTCSHTDTDPSGHLCIMTDILVGATATSLTHNITVKVDPGAEANLMPVHHFRRIFPYMCDTQGQPKEGVLNKADSSFESYSSNRTYTGTRKKHFCKKIHPDKTICDSQKRGSHPLKQLSKPMDGTD